MDDLSTRTGALERATSLFDLISEQAAAGERQGRLTDSVATALLGAGLLSILLPERVGGLGASRRDFFDAVEAIARADGSAGWCASVCNTVNHAAFLGLPAEGRDEVFGRGPVSCWTSLLPRAVFAAEADGFRVSCPGSFGSGSSLSNWVLVAANTGGAREGRYRAFLLPKAEVEIEEGSWDVMGLRATASIDYQITDRLVPARRSWEYQWTSTDASGPLSAVEAVRLNAIGLSAFASGVGQRALSELVASAVKTRRTVAEGVQAEDSVVQFGIGELDGRMRAARTHLAGLVSAMDERAAQGRTASPEEGIDLAQACQTLARAARDTVVFAFDYAGASVVYARQPLQRCLRDIFTGLKHAAFTPAFLSLVGKRQLGLPYARTVL
ncbi:MAG: acyl-CoA dehydrogenase family protein [Caulobacterales bacterium]